MIEALVPRPNLTLEGGMRSRQEVSVAALVVAMALTACNPDPAPPDPVPPDPIPPQPAGVLSVVNMIPATLSRETGQDSEPFLAVHPADGDLMAASAFTRNPGGAASGTAPIFVSDDGGGSWTLRNTVPSSIQTGDISHAFDENNGELYAGILRRPGGPTGLRYDALETQNHLATTPMTVNLTRDRVDQPFVQASSDGTTDLIYVGNNDFNIAPQTATVDVSDNGGSAFTTVAIEPRGTSGQNGPSVRPAAAPDGTVYAAYFGWRSFDGSTAVSDVVVVRDDNRATGADPFQDLLGSDGLAGNIVTQVSIPWSNASTLGQERIGSTLSIAVDPNQSSTVYVAWGDRVGSETYTIHVRRSTDSGQNWSGDLVTLTDATNVSLAINDGGRVGLLYQQVTGVGSDQRWVTHLQVTADGFQTSDDYWLATVPASSPTAQFLPYLGDYAYLLAVGAEFRGVFSANNSPVSSNFPNSVVYQRSADFSAEVLQDPLGQPVSISIDPFFFAVQPN